MGLPCSLLSFAASLIFYNMVFAFWIVSFVVELLVSASAYGLVYSLVAVCCCSGSSCWFALLKACPLL
jgi:hypothetical protein